MRKLKRVKLLNVDNPDWLRVEMDRRVCRNGDFNLRKAAMPRYQASASLFAGG